MLDPLTLKPNLGSYLGALPPVDLGPQHSGLLYLKTKRKKWVYVSIQARDWLIGLAVVDLGYLSKSFAYAYDGNVNRIVATRSMLAPSAASDVANHWATGAKATFWLPLLATRIDWPAGSEELRISVACKELEVLASLSLAGAPAPVSSIVHPDGDRSLLNTNEKRLLIPTMGFARVNGNRVLLDGGFAAIDYTHGILPRQTRWRWVSLSGFAKTGEKVGVNLVQGFNGEVECAVWVNNDVFPVGEGEVEYDPENPRSTWRIKSRCEAVDLALEVGDLHQETTNVKLVAAKFTQATGRYSGTIKLPGREPLILEGVLGVAEDQDTLW